ncbi:MAG: hypothetical protein IKL92_02175, partial [Oscillospiraceae bacterium]|nr:hypothetical protein [Oscillospiraceae bacterium]
MGFKPHKNIQKLLLVLGETSKKVILEKNGCFPRCGMLFLERKVTAQLQISYLSKKFNPICTGW